MTVINNNVGALGVHLRRKVGFENRNIHGTLIIWPTH